MLYIYIILYYIKLYYIILYYNIYIYNMFYVTSWDHVNPGLSPSSSIGPQIYTIQFRKYTVNGRSLKHQLEVTKINYIA